MWKAYQVVFELLSPLHLGCRRAGNFAETRRYVPGRAIWGALTSRITRDAGGEDYAEVGRQVQEELAWTYFFVSATLGNVPLWPWDRNEREFEWLFLSSFSSTALEDGHNADEGALHEVEYIAPHTRCGDQVYLTGYLFEREGSTLNWRSALSRLQIGGERSYGWGRVRPATIMPFEGPCFGICPVHTDCDRPVIEVPDGSALLAHTLASDSESHQGTIEPLVGRQTDTATAAFGATVSAALICWTPGTRIVQTSKYEIGQHGIWKPL
ncbi:MAG TPA: CRISPR-associated protein [Acidobacteriota bacterium]|nr:CRISPR-associated protein [Acidobacteriota bacterium]